MLCNLTYSTGMLGIASLGSPQVSHILMGFKIAFLVPQKVARGLCAFHPNLA